jgi:hypothetical protein
MKEVKKIRGFKKCVAFTVKEYDDKKSYEEEDISKEVIVEFEVPIDATTYKLEKNKTYADKAKVVAIYDIVNGKLIESSEKEAYKGISIRHVNMLEDGKTVKEYNEVSTKQKYVVGQMADGIEVRQDLRNRDGERWAPCYDEITFYENVNLAISRSRFA